MILKANGSTITTRCEGCQEITPLDIVTGGGEAVHVCPQCQHIISSQKDPVKEAVDLVRRMKEKEKKKKEGEKKEVHLQLQAV